VSLRPRPRGGDSAEIQEPRRQAYRIDQGTSQQSGPSAQKPVAFPIDLTYT